MAKNFLFTSESVSEGHPDKIADQISDVILDAILIQDQNAKVACETFVKTGFVLVGGEINTSAWVDVEQLTRKTINEIGYISSDMGFDGESCGIINTIGKQSPDIAQGVEETEDKEQGAGDQGIMFGYACNETETLIPAPIYYAHRLIQQQTKVRKEKLLPWLRPDAKSQVTMQYKDNLPVSIEAIVLSTQHAPEISYNQIKEAVIEEIIKPIIPKNLLHNKTKFYINPTGRFVVGGPMGDCGVTGRKVIVDTYGGMARHGGGAFSGKDPSKVDRSGAYAARYIAKNIVAARLASRCEIQISYAIGVAEPISINVDTFGTNTIAEEKIYNLIKDNFPLKPKDIINTLELLNPIYSKTSNYGHFGRSDLIFPWEKINMVDLLK